MRCYSKNKFEEKYLDCILHLFKLPAEWTHWGVTSTIKLLGQNIFLADVVVVAGSPCVEADATKPIHVRFTLCSWGLGQFWPPYHKLQAGTCIQRLWEDQCYCRPPDLGEFLFFIFFEYNFAALEIVLIKITNIKINNYKWCFRSKWVFA